jgi:outer membrane receptor for ferrienterochelin and colicin
MIRSTLFLALFLSSLGAPGSAAAQTGTITGRVLSGKVPAANVNVVVLGASRGAITDAEGAFRITLVPVGTHSMRVQRIGSGMKTLTIHVDAGVNALPAIQLGADEVVSEFVIEVKDRFKPVDKTRTGTVYQFDREKMDAMPVDDVYKMIATQPGIVIQADEIHLRGGRSDEVKVHHDGIEIANPLVQSTPAFANLGIAGVEVLPGALNAEHGRALGGIINITTREGTSKFEGEAQWHTDRYGESGKTFNNYDRVTAGMGGPTPLAGLTWFATYEGVFSDTYLNAHRTQSTKSFFDFLRLGNRQANAVNLDAKLAWKLPGSRKLTLEAVQNRALSTPYNHMWSRRGFVSVTSDTTDDGRLVPRYGRWSAFAEDSTFQYQNLADHVPTTDARFAHLKAIWTQALSSNDVLSVRLSRFRFDTVTSVDGKKPWEYDVRSPQYWFGNLDADPFFATHGDFPIYNEQHTTTWTAKADYTTRRWKGHTAKAGVEGIYNEVRQLAMQFPNQEAQGLPGLNRSDYVNYNPEGSAFLQDRWEYEGLVLNAGMRYDLFTPGPQIPAEDLPGGRYKAQVSPRLGIAYPVSDRDVLSFHYGWTFQTPQRNFVFENRSSQSTVAVRGNPDLAPETNISYQAALQHLFSKDVSGQFSVFFKDIFGLIAVRQEVDALTGLLVPVYVNQDYASARGFEASVSKRFSHRFSGELNYTYSIATGVASDPNSGLQFAQGNALYLPIAEQALDWDQSHTLNANVIVRDPGKWGVTLLWQFGSGLPYTPTFRNDRKPDPRYKNTRRLPSQSQLSIVADKFFRIWGQNVTFFLDARNVLDSRSIQNPAPSNFPNPYIDQIGQDYLVYYTETGRAGGAYLRDTDGDRVDDWVAVHDPRVFSEGRNIRVGAGVSF